MFQYMQRVLPLWGEVENIAHIDTLPHYSQKEAHKLHIATGENYTIADFGTTTPDEIYLVTGKKYIPLERRMEGFLECERVGYCTIAEYSSETNEWKLAENLILRHKKTGMLFIYIHDYDHRIKKPALFKKELLPRRI